MHKILMLMWLGILPLLQACDSKKPPEPSKTQVRSMIIGGVPVDDRDYQLDSKPIIAADYPAADEVLLDK